MWLSVPKKVTNSQFKCDQEWNNLIWGSAAYFHLLLLLQSSSFKGYEHNDSAESMCFTSIFQNSNIEYRSLFFESAWLFSLLTDLDWLANQNILNLILIIAIKGK